MEKKKRQINSRIMMEIIQIIMVSFTTTVIKKQNTPHARTL